MGDAMVAAHQKGRQTAGIGPADRRMLAPGAQLQEGRAGNAQQATHLPGPVDPLPRDAGRPEEGFELGLGHRDHSGATALALHAEGAYPRPPPDPLASARRRPAFRALEQRRDRGLGCYRPRSRP